MLSYQNNSKIKKKEMFMIEPGIVHDSCYFGQQSMWTWYTLE